MCKKNHFFQQYFKFWQAIKNLIFATGHAMMGWGMGTATGLAVSEILDNINPSINIENYSPDRKF